MASVGRYELTKLPEVNMFEERVDEEVIRTSNTLNESSTLSFHWTSTADEYIDLNKCKLHVVYKMTRANGRVFTAATGNNSIVEPNLFHNLWKDITLRINDQVIRSSVQHYPYQAYIEALIGSTPEMEPELNELEGWYIPHGSQMDGATVIGKDATADNNEDIPALRSKTRTTTIANKEQTLIGLLNLDIFKQQRVLPPLTRVGIDLKKNDVGFWATSNPAIGDHKTGINIRIEDIFFVVTKRKLFKDDGRGQLSANTLLLKELATHQSARYPHTRSMLKVFSIPQTNTVYTNQSLFDSKVPVKAIVGLVSATRYHGDATLSPFAFKHYSVKTLYMTYGGDKYPARTYETDFTTGRGVKELWQQTTKGLMFPKDDNFRSNITYEEFLSDNGNKNFWVIDLTQNKKSQEPEDSYLSQPQNKEVGIHITVSEAFGEAVQLIVLAYLEDSLTIDHASGEVYTSW